ncbi:MAG: energy-coupling factor transporter transmembrane component T [Eubacteriales bacterium]|nr:energy-coupling factor transporter transmembrane component T [Eubacteriales bacterium]
MVNLFNYIDRPSPVHRLTGATKLICLILWTLAGMVTYDTRILILMPLISIVLFMISKIRLKDISFMLAATAVFMVLNNVMVYVFSPEYGCRIYGSRTLLFKIAGNYTVTREQLFYHFNLFLKYLSSIPIILLFLCTTNPSEFAASLNKVGLSYKFSYAIALALRYIPDIQKEYHDISQAQQARGVELSKKESLFNRLKSATTILIPLIISSMDKIETISNAMELRGFGKNSKRTWYNERRFTKADYISIAFCVILFAVSVLGIVIRGNRFWSPF